MTMSCLLLLLLFSFTINNVSEARHLNKKKLPSAVIVGTVYCDTCFHQEVSKYNHFISGALVAVACGDSSSPDSTFYKEVKTNKKGEFKVNLPLSISKHVKKIEGCYIKLIKSSEPYCAVASSATSSSLRLKSKQPGKHIFSAGFFTFKPLNQPLLCSQKPSIKDSKEITSLSSFMQYPNKFSFPPALQDPPEPFIPPIPELPKLPPLPTLPVLPPGIVGPPSPNTPKSADLFDQKTFGFPFPPNPLLPPPSLFPPLPFQPPSSIIPPILPTPPPSLFPPISFPPVPSLIPSPPPPPPSLFPPFPHLPPFPFQPAPGFPGVPPASSSKKPSP